MKIPILVRFLKLTLKLNSNYYNFIHEINKFKKDLLTVNETSTEPPQDDDQKNINSPHNLALEATFINHNLAQQVLRMVKLFEIQL